MLETQTDGRRAIASLIFFLSAISCWAQNEVRFEKITVDDGLSQSSVTSIVQDKFGYLWIATLDGLNRYDGRDFKVFRKSEKDSNSIDGNNVHALFLDNQQSMWASYSGGFSRYIPETDVFVNYSIDLPIDGVPASYLVTDFDVISDSITVLSTNHGIVEFNTVTGVFRHAERFSEFDFRRVRSFFSSPEIGTWVILSKEAYVQFPGSQQWVSVLKHSGLISSLYCEKTKEVYFQTADHLYKFNFDQRKVNVIAKLSSTEQMHEYHHSLLKLSNGELWVAREAIYVFDQHDSLSKVLPHVPQNPYSISGYLSCLYESRDGVVWVGTNGLGLNKYNHLLSVFNYFGTFPGAPITLSNNFITSVFTKDDIHIYVGTLNGLDLIDLKNNTSQHLIQDRDIHINRIFEDDQGVLWLATTKGMMKVVNNKILPSGIKDLDDPGRIFFDVFPVKPDKILLSTGKGLILWTPASGEIKIISSKGTTTSLLTNDTYWTEFEIQIRLINAKDNTPQKTFVNVAADSTSFPRAWIKCFYQDTEGKIWIGTWGEGLVLYDPVKQNFTHFTERNGLPNSAVYGILEDKAGNLWLSTNKGICVFDKKKKKSIRNFFKNDGLQSNEFNTRAFYKSPSGKMYFGGVNGLTFFKPEEALHTISPLPKSIITGFFIDNNRVDRLKNGRAISQIVNNVRINLESNQRNFSFEIAGLGFTFPSGIQFKYMLENFDPAWIYIGQEKRISFTNIPPGEYKFKVKASNSFGDWEPDGLTIDIVVKAPYWKTLWFIISAIFVTFGIVLGFYFQRTSHLKKRARILEELVRNRTHEIQKQQNEIAEQNLEIVAKNEELSNQAEAIDNRNAELEKIKISLEERVEERTQDLQQLNEDLIDQNIQLEQFAFITAHNIRGPVARIKGLISLLPQDRDAEVKTHLKISVNNLDEVISDLNTVLNIRHGINRSYELVNLKSTLLLTLQSLNGDISKINAEINTSNFNNIVAKGLRPYFHSIFFNLLHNALRYADSSRKTVIHCTAEVVNGKVIITIADNGMGIDMKYAREKIFKLYQRFHLEITGKGLGLFLVKTQVEALGGKISVDSVLNQGTTFTIEFPIR